jgi:hypothetical protein
MQKRYIFLLAFMLLATYAASAQTQYLKDFQRKYRGSGESIRIGVGALPLKLAASLIPASAFDDDEGVVIKKLLKKVKHVKVYAIENGRAVSSTAISDLRQTLIDKARLEPLMEMRDGDSDVYILNKGREDELGNVVILAKDDTDLVMVHLETSLHINDVQLLLDHFVKN